MNMNMNIINEYVNEYEYQLMNTNYLIPILNYT